MCALESLALGTPIVSTPTDGLCELIKNGVNGFISDEDADIAQCICELVSNEKKCARMSCSAREISKEQNLKRPYKDKVTEVYRRANG